MQNHKIVLPLLFTLLSLFNLNSGKSQVKIDLNSSITTRHYWRGIMVSNSINYEADLVVGTPNFSFGAWGGYAFDNEYSEFDFHMDYRLSDRLSISLWDLYASRDRSSIDQYDYFDFDRKTTNHLLDASINYTFGPKFPLSICWSTLLWGRDLDEHGNQNYSSYLELAYPITIGDTNVRFFMGANVFENSTYGENTNIVNMGLTATKQLKINENLQLPIWGTLAVNPEMETANLILGINF
jgi:hypothetical protein